MRLRRLESRRTTNDQAIFTKRYDWADLSSRELPRAATLVSAQRKGRPMKTRRKTIESIPEREEQLTLFANGVRYAPPAKPHRPLSQRERALLKRCCGTDNHPLIAYAISLFNATIVDIVPRRTTRLMPRKPAAPSNWEEPNPLQNPGNLKTNDETISRPKQSKKMPSEIHPEICVGSKAYGKPSSSTRSRRAHVARTVAKHTPFITRSPLASSR